MYEKGVIYLFRLIILLIAIGVAIFVSPESIQASAKELHTHLTGANEIPGPGDPDGLGMAHITLDHGKGLVCYHLMVAAITLPASGAHIHHGGSSEAGPVVVPLSPPNETGISEGCVEVEKELIRDIRKNSSHYYVNIHSNDYPAGAVRGQL